MILLGNIHLHSDIDAGFYDSPGPKLIRFSFLKIEHAFSTSSLLKLSFSFVFYRSSQLAPIPALARWILASISSQHDGP